MAYTLVTFSAGLLDDVASRWRGIAGDDVYEVELVPMFDYCRENRSFRHGYGFVRGLQDNETGEVDAIIETVPSPRKSRTKLLKIWLSPRMWSSEEGTIDTDAVVHTYAGAYLSVLAEAIGEGLSEVKMYAREATALTLLTHVCEMWDSASTGWEARMEGRWLSMQSSS